MISGTHGNRTPRAEGAAIPGGAGKGGRATLARFAWDGVALDVPADWNLATILRHHDGFAGVLEDDAAVRLEVEWQVLARPPDLAVLERRQARRLGRLARAAVRTGPLDSLPSDWRATHFDFSDGRCLIAALGPVPCAPERLTMLRFHFDTSGEASLDSARQVIASARQDDAGGRLWQVYDCAFRLTGAFHLERAELLAGRKRFSFAWRGRRLDVWFMGFADRLLKDRTPAAWAAEFLGAHFRGRGPRFEACGEGVVAVRPRALPWGHYTEWRHGRRYAIMAARRREQNQLVLAAFQHWKPDEPRLLAELEASLRPAVWTWPS